MFRILELQCAHAHHVLGLPAGFGTFGPPLHLRPCTWYIPNYPILPKSHFPKNPFSPIKPIQNTISSHFPKISFSQNHIFLKSFFPKSYPQKSPFPKITFSQSHFPKIKFSQKNIFPQSHFPAIPFFRNPISRNHFSQKSWRTDWQLGFLI